jgi:MFS transporter, MHS family, shikimate and dehydroshikimate transport protein
MLVLLASVFPFVAAVEAKSYEGILACYVLVMAVGHAACHASQASLFSDMFPTSVRYTGISAGYQTSGTVFAGPLPIISTALIAAAGGGVRLFFGYVFAVGVVSLVAIMVSKPHHSLVRRRGQREDNSNASGHVALSGARSR